MKEFLKLVAVKIKVAPFYGAQCRMMDNRELYNQEIVGSTPGRTKPRKGHERKKILGSRSHVKL